MTPPDRRPAKRGRAVARAAFVESRAGVVDNVALADALARRLQADDAEVRSAAGDVHVATFPVPGAFPAGDANRWVPIGPSAVRLGQAVGRPRVTGRVRDLAVDGNGVRAYAASAQGGLWYTSDAGASWAPVGGWHDRAATAGGHNHALVCGCVLVAFGNTEADDHVMVGTGELTPSGSPNVPRRGGLGVLAGRGPATTGAGGRPWDLEAGLAVLEGRGVYRLARHPGAVAGLVVPRVDLVVAAASDGLYVGQLAPPFYAWRREAAFDAFLGVIGRTITDVLWWNDGTANGRLFVAVAGLGVAFCDDLDGAAVPTFTWLPGFGPGGAIPVTGRQSLAMSPDAAVPSLFVLAGQTPAAVPALWRVAPPSGAAPAPVTVALPAALPPVLWGTQSEYDQAIAVDSVGGVERVYLGGSAIQPTAGSDHAASLWCFDVTAGPALSPTPGVSDVGLPPAAGADQAGLVGNDVHADVHAIRLATAGATRQVWVGCDGGVYVSAQAGQCNTFGARGNGMAVIEAGFHASHPTSGHYSAIGVQDNGTQVRTGDTVWEAAALSDGGGVMFHPTNTEVLVAQNTSGAWIGVPSAAFTDPLDRTQGYAAATRESIAASFYSGCAAIARTAGGGRMALGTNRVWVTDDVSSAGTNTWVVLPVSAPAVATAGAPKAATDPRAGGVDVTPAFGVPASLLGAVIALDFRSDTELIAVYATGMVRYIEATPGNWTDAQLLPVIVPAPPPPPPPPPPQPNTATTVLTDVAAFPSPSINIPPGPNPPTDIYVTTTGDPANAAEDTCWLFTLGSYVATGLRTALAGPLDPAYAVAIDPFTPNIVYVGTATGVWRGVRNLSTDVHTWTPFMNGLPEASVQDLSFWGPPAGAAPRLLRAAMQARGVWETDLAAANEPRRTYVRVHAHDDRRMLPTPLIDPRAAAGAAALSTRASPDIVVRPASPPATAPTWKLKATQTISATNAPAYQLWTFQTAFRWKYPSVVADGTWSDRFGDLVRFERTLAPALPAGDFIDQALWTRIVTNGHIDANGAFSATAGDPLAVYRAPWHTAAAPVALATEIDLMELVVPVRMVGDLWHVHREPCTVEVLVHHRDTRPLDPNDAAAILLTADGANPTTLMATNASGVQAYVASVMTGTAGAPPAGFTTVMNGASELHGLASSLDARMPRAVPINVDLSGFGNGRYVLLVAIVTSSQDFFTQAPVAPVVTVTDLVRNWPYAAARLVRVYRR